MAELLVALETYLKPLLTMMRVMVAFWIEKRKKSLTRSILVRLKLVYLGIASQDIGKDHAKSCGQSRPWTRQSHKVHHRCFSYCESSRLFFLRSFPNISFNRAELSRKDNRIINQIKKLTKDASFLNTGFIWLSIFLKHKSPYLKSKQTQVVFLSYFQVFFRKLNSKPW